MYLGTQELKVVPKFNILNCYVFKFLMKLVIKDKKKAESNKSSLRF